MQLHKSMTASPWRDIFEPITVLRGERAGEHALVIGNSPWRSGFPLAAWRGPTIGCNALYRDFMPSYLCLMDSYLIGRTTAAGVGLQTKMVVRAGETRRQFLANKAPAELGKQYVIGDEFEFGTMAGTTAIGLAGYLGCHSITLVGFSMDETNVYLGTDAYQKTAGITQPGGIPHSMIRMWRALDEYRRLVPGGSIHFIGPGEWMLGQIERSVSCRCAISS